MTDAIPQADWSNLPRSEQARIAAEEAYARSSATTIAGKLSDALEAAQPHFAAAERERIIASSSQGAPEGDGLALPWTGQSEGRS